MARSLKAHDVAGMVICLGVALFLVVTILKSFHMAFGFIFPIISPEEREGLQRNGTVTPMFTVTGPSAVTVGEAATVTVREATTVTVREATTVTVHEAITVAVTVPNAEALTSVSTKVDSCSPTSKVRTFFSQWSTPVAIVHDLTSAETSMKTLTFTGALTQVVCAPSLSTPTSFNTVYTAGPIQTGRNHVAVTP
ncbi:uncharacterized protein BKCO1_1000462 [Diplodia corticola]|uniref:Uncharacterized protein n=1 Tax=Diplodia corticola TaxID=236234 RepID=A0A1J9S6D5_9PEZI|nr:uncharacterized protein BKCO1_1000462 [Diplodia corticola]OJD40499.1 hypothetical protein BKCO1_1000462 [Diplodia corticola]